MAKTAIATATPGVAKLTTLEVRLWVACMVTPGILAAIVFAVRLF